MLCATLSVAICETVRFIAQAHEEVAGFFGNGERTFEKIGIPEAERKFLAGVTAQYDSEAVYHSINKELEKQGVVFLGKIGRAHV